jgi:integrase
VKPYDCRHSFATNLRRNKVSRADARVLMRHSSVSVVMERVYEHLDAEDVAPAVANLPDPVLASAPELRVVSA